MVSTPPQLRVGELSRRLGVNSEVLPAWYRRYGLTRPMRRAGGFRIYSDAVRIERMQKHPQQGFSTAEAAHAAIEETPAPAEIVERPAGWRIVFLGADVTTSTIEEAVRALKAAVRWIASPGT